MTKKNKASHRVQPAQGMSCNCLNPCVVCHCKQPSPKTQPPRMGAALRFALKQYTADLYPLAESGDKIALRMVDDCSHLLNDSDRLEGGNYD